MKNHLSTIPSLLSECYKKFSKKTAMFLTNGAKINYSDMLWDVTRTSTILREQGISKNAKIVVFMNDSPQTVETFLAITRMGAIAVMLRYDFSKEQIKQIIDNEEPAAIFISEDKMNILPEGYKATILEMADNRILQSVDREVPNLGYTVNDNDIATIIYQVSENKLTRERYSQKDIVSATRKIKKANQVQTNNLTTIVEYAKNRVCPILNGISVYCKEMLTSISAKKHSI